MSLVVLFIVIYFLSCFSHAYIQFILLFPKSLGV
jgi:hypothetical protein